ncbi:hypothetical protein Ddye_012302 [Dipteronia dyeriana]|uniref:RNase H type-1 domain-containing protein n=1 Tax=Dipteronia dyeriana TaxID=168575 RepID=A0AAD9X489_9ROSI|nr:hypothetical protein Ddye_012302 [Dipteronia dyeriana]
MGDDSVVAWSESYLTDFRGANLMASGGSLASNSGVFAWKPWDEVIRNFRGSVMASSVQHVLASYSSLIAKVMAVLRGLNLAIELGLKPFLTETDALAVVKMICCRGFFVG